jgi:hypothetical protein
MAHYNLNTRNKIIILTMLTSTMNIRNRNEKSYRDLSEKNSNLDFFLPPPFPEPLWTGETLGSLDPDAGGDEDPVDEDSDPVRPLTSPAADLS